MDIVFAWRLLLYDVFTACYFLVLFLPCAATIYLIITVDCAADFIKKTLFPSQKLSGIQSLKREDVASDNFLGFGVAITGSSCYNLAKMEQVERTEFLKSIYSIDGLGLSVGRVSVGASDYSAQVYSYDDVDGDINLEHFSIEKDKEYIIPILKEIVAINKDIYLYA